MEEAAEGGVQGAVEATERRHAAETLHVHAHDKQGGDTSEEGSATASDGGHTEIPLVNPSKKRRSTYQVRREEKEQLQAQIEALQHRLKVIEEEQRNEKTELAESLEEHAHLASRVEATHTALAGAQSLLSSFMSTEWKSPLATRIHLTTDPEQRRKFLDAIYEHKVDSATKFMLERTRFLDLRREHCHTESCELPNGDFVFTRFDVTPFGRTVTAQQVFDEMLLFMTHEEISISESLGLLTVLEAELPATPVIKQTRLLSTFGGGVEVETNAVLFRKFVDAGPDSYGVGVIDFVDKDDLSPPTLPTRIQKDITACGFIAACPQDEVGAPPIVSVTRYTSVCIRAPPFALRKHQEAMVRNSVRQWGDVMINVMQERLGLS